MRETGDQRQGRKVTSLRLRALRYENDILDNPRLHHSHPRCQPPNFRSRALGELPLSPASWLSPPHCPVCLLFPAAQTETVTPPSHTHALYPSLSVHQTSLLRARFQIEHAQGTGKMRVGYHLVARYILSNDCPARKCSRFKLRTPVNWHISN